MMSLPVVVHPDVELWATGWLRTALAARSEPFAKSVYVSNTVPPTRRDRMVTVRRDGGARLDQVREAPRLGVNVWGSSDQEATDLALLVAGLLCSAADGAPVLRVRQLSGPSPIADAQPRVYMTFELHTRGTQV